MFPAGGFRKLSYSATGFERALQHAAERTADQIFNTAGNADHHLTGSGRYRTTDGVTVGRSIARTALLLRMVGVGVYGGGLARASLQQGDAAGRRHATVEVLASGSAIAWNTYLMRRLDGHGGDGIRRHSTYLNADIAVSALLSLLVARLAPAGSLAGGSGVQIQSSMVSGAVWSSLKGVGSGVTAVLAGGVMSPTANRLNGSSTLPHTLIHPFWGAVGVAIVGLATALIDVVGDRPLPDRTPTGRALQTPDPRHDGDPEGMHNGADRSNEDAIAVSGIVHNTALHSIEQVLESADLPPEAIEILRNARFKLRAFLDNPGNGNGQRSLGTALTEALAPLDSPAFTVELICHTEQLPVAVVTAATIAAHAAAANTARHAHTDRVTVTARIRDGGQLVVAIRDEGVGFDAMAPVGYGLQQAVGRVVNDVGGTITVRTGGTFQGTLIQLTFDADTILKHS